MASLLERSAEFKTLALDYLEPHGISLEDIKTGRDAWAIA